MNVSHGAFLVMIMALAGCSDAGLRDLRSNTSGPDEFLVLPVKPLSAPDNYSDLPEPAPGSSNLVDPNPKAEAVAALGGRISSSEGIPASDAGLVQYARRHGVPGDIRETLAAEDEAFRKRRGRLTQIRLFRTDRYSQVYNKQGLDPFATTLRARGSGLATPTSPPETNR